MDASKGGDDCEWREERGPDQPLQTRFALVEDELRTEDSNAASLLVYVLHWYTGSSTLCQA